MPYATLTTEEIGRRGEEIYQEQIRPLVKTEHRGKFLVLDIESGDYGIDTEDATATSRLLTRRPGATTYGVRIGYRAAYRFGGASLTGTP